MTQLYRIEHKTTYTYDDDVTDSYGATFMRPRDLPAQTCLAHETRISPSPADQYRFVDIHGNTQTYFHVTTAHRELVVAGVSVVEVRDPEYDESALGMPWEQARPDHSDDPNAWQAIDYTLDSSLIEITPELFEYAAASFPPGRPIGEAVDDLNTRIYHDFTYSHESTNVSTPATKALQLKAGVCQDFAQVLIGCLRSHGLAGRYVSGYLRTFPPPGKERLIGADATHAWAAAWIPGTDWLAVDPTNNKRCNDTHATTAWGRDYRDVPPVRGVIFTEAKDSKLAVSVDMAPVSEMTVAPSSPGV